MISRDAGGGSSTQLQDALLTTFSLGRTAKTGDMRGLYTFTIKDANSLISQLTDDEIGTGLGVNIATHHFRFDYALHPNVLFSNYLWVQNERRSSNPAASFLFLWAVTLLALGALRRK